jgi:hypothetical protein
MMRLSVFCRRCHRCIADWSRDDPRALVILTDACALCDRAERDKPAAE